MGDINVIEASHLRAEGSCRSFCLAIKCGVAEVLRQLGPELARLLAETSGARSTDARNPSPEASACDVQWSSNNPQEDEARAEPCVRWRGAFPAGRASEAADDGGEGHADAPRRGGRHLLADAAGTRTASRV